MQEEYVVKVSGIIARRKWIVRAQKEILKHPEKVVHIDKETGCNE